jgi:hypothetical protein
MTVITDIAQRILDENNYTVSDISLTNLEYIIKNAVDHINAQAGTNISFTPAAGAASLIASDIEIITTKNLSTLLLRAYVDRGPNTSVGGLSVTTVANDPQYNIFMELVKDDIIRLRGRSFEVT